MLNPLELKFLAYEELVEVEPSFNISLSLLSSSLDLVPLSITKIPLFVALELKKGNLLQIRNPSYYNLQSLINFLEEEINSEKEYLNIPPFIFSTGKLIISNSYNCDKKEECYSVIEKLKEVRLRKTLNGLSKMEGKPLTLSNLTLYEWYEVKNVIVGPMEERKRLL